jgi:hypothetical protein
MCRLVAVVSVSVLCTGPEFWNIRFWHLATSITCKSNSWCHVANWSQSYRVRSISSSGVISTVSEQESIGITAPSYSVGRGSALPVCSSFGGTGVVLRMLFSSSLTTASHTTASEHHLVAEPAGCISYDRWRAVGPKGTWTLLMPRQASWAITCTGWHFTQREGCSYQTSKWQGG